MPNSLIRKSRGAVVARVVCPHSHHLGVSQRSHQARLHIPGTRTPNWYPTPPKGSPAVMRGASIEQPWKFAGGTSQQQSVGEEYSPSGVRTELPTWFVSSLHTFAVEVPVAKFLQTGALWAEIRRRARSSRKLTAVVSYLGQHPDRLIHWPRTAIVVADLSDQTVRRGAPPQGAHSGSFARGFESSIAKPCTRKSFSLTGARLSDHRIFRSHRRMSSKRQASCLPRATKWMRCVVTFTRSCPRPTP